VKPAVSRLYLDDGDLDAKCPTEIGITDRRGFEHQSRLQP
jgi:predicted component of type VI protein secretion system